MPCSSSANQYVRSLVGDTSEQIDSSIGGVLKVVSPQYQIHQGSMAGQVGGRRRSRKNIRRRSTKHHKKRSHKRKSRKMIRKRK
jgi:hypothetical protein